MIVLGLDPGSRRTGWGAVRQEGARFVLLGVGVLRPSPSAGLPERLAALHREVAALLARLEPDLVGLESVFHGPNTRSLVTLGQARGAILAAVGAAGRHLLEMSPAEVKKAVTGQGGARKEQVAHMIGVLLGADAVRRALDGAAGPGAGRPDGPCGGPADGVAIHGVDAGRVDGATNAASAEGAGERGAVVSLDATDALAVAVAAFHRHRRPGGGSTARRKAVLERLARERSVEPGSRRPRR